MIHLKRLLFSAASAQAFFVLTQPILLTTRLDPIVDPGVASGHVHSIAGGSNFDKTMTYESTQESICTTAPITVDKSNYWIPQLYYYNPETTGYQAIPAAYVNTYYLPRGGTNDTVTAFPDGLRMVSGNPSRREFNPDDVDNQAISFVCLDYAGGHEGDPAWDQRNNFFEHNCPDGLRAQVNFRTCWNGADLDSPDHRSHMSWPTNGNNNGGGDCPASHPVKVVQLFYEFIFEVQKFPFNPAGTPTWVFANGDATGYGLHADFINGWPQLINGTNVLQRAIDECNDNLGVGGVLTDCRPFDGLINEAQAQSCRPENGQVDEDIGFNREIAFLPGNNPLWVGDGPKPSTPNYTEGDTNYTDFKSILPVDWSYVGCISEAPTGRALEAYTFSAPNMTRAVCAAECGKRGYPLSGTQYAEECYCDSEMRNAASNTTLLAPEMCDLRCVGNRNDDCGGYRTLSLFVNPLLYVKTVLPNPVVYAGVDGWFMNERNCVAEPEGRRALTGLVLANDQMTPEACMSLCQARGFSFAGTQWASECYCGASLDTGASEADPSTCESCGGSRRLNMYYFNSTATTGESTLPQDWSAFGCWNGQASSSRAFTGSLLTADTMTNEVCMLECQSKGFAYAGIEYGRECRCAPEFASGSIQALPSSCDMPCAGSPFEVCGGSNRMTTFRYTGSLTPVITPTPSSPNNTDVQIEGWANRGCFTEGSGGRALPAYTFSKEDMTIPTCLAECGARGFKFGGVEYGKECYCGHSISINALAATEGCTMVCPGDASTVCGGSNRLNIFESTAPPPSTPLEWNYRGCYTEAVSARAVQGAYKTSGDMDSAVCLAFAKENGHTWAALVYGRECFTGYSLTPTSAITAESECAMPCAGSADEMCGGGDRASVYQLGGEAASARQAPVTSSSIAPPSSLTSSPSATSSSTTSTSEVETPATSVSPSSTLTESSTPLAALSSSSSSSSSSPSSTSNILPAAKRDMTRRRLAGTNRT